MTDSDEGYESGAVINLKGSLFFFLLMLATAIVVGILGGDSAFAQGGSRFLGFYGRVLDAFGNA